MHDLVIHYRKNNTYKNYLIENGQIVKNRDLDYLAKCICKFLGLGVFDEE